MEENVPEIECNLKCEKECEEEKTSKRVAYGKSKKGKREEPKCKEDWYNNDDSSILDLYASDSESDCERV